MFHHKNGPLHEELHDMLCAWVVARSDEGLGYTLGAAKICAMLLINMPVQQGFVVMRNLLERHCMRSFFGGEGSREDVGDNPFLQVRQRKLIPCAGGSILPVSPRIFMSHKLFTFQHRIFDTLLADGMPKSKLHASSSATLFLT